MWKIASTCICWHCVADVVKICNGIHCACTVKLWVGIIRLNTWWSCSINSWLDAIFKNIPFFFFPLSPLLFGYWSLQTGTFRMNCLDCLDRTNSVQSFVALEVSLSQDLSWCPMLCKLSVPQGRQERGHKPQWHKSFLPALCYRMMLAGILKLRIKSKNILKKNVLFLFFCTKSRSCLLN